ncbi:hypothetical protein Tco_0957455, partial [Tanacetum coccineum]
AHTIDIRGEDTHLPPQTEQCPQPKQVTKNDVKSRREPQDPAHNMNYTTASAAFIYASQLAVMGLKKTDELFEDNNLLNLVRVSLWSMACGIVACVFLKHDSKAGGRWRKSGIYGAYGLMALGIALLMYCC